ncbi:ABC transporter [Cristinia sonorae]|uniref:ABC transporter n=1 Tax=Cristinia sonorae TaxID=1940300 RepID=A0A8K0UMZ5_9AGAR|nr:ABC transporter [Cristinia sonorae]
MATSCENYGVVNGSTCACPVGVGGSTCSQPACGGTIFQGSSRSLVPLPSNANTLANITAASCSCESGWKGTGCNVCQTASACQSGFAAVSGSSSSTPNIPTGQVNETMVCNTAPRIYAAGSMSCDVQNPTLQALYPRAANLNILRTLNPAFTPLPNITGFGTNGSIYAQLFYDGIEQFYCKADSCTQDLGSGDGSSEWDCNNLQCTCRQHSSFCGGGPLDLGGILNFLNGTVSVSCGVPASDGTASCAFKQSTINSVFGNGGLTLDGCVFGECVRQNVVDTVSASTSNSTDDPSHSSLSGGVIAGLAVIGALVGLALFFLAFGWWVQRRARRSGTSSSSKMGGTSVEWTHVSYFVPNSAQGLFGYFGRSKRDLSDHKVVLDNVTGRVLPGQMMAILGPSGAGKTTLIEILAGKSKTGHTTGKITFPSSGAAPRVGFVPQQDILPPMLTVHEALLFSARLRLPENVPDSEKLARVDDVIDKLGLNAVRDVRIGDGEKRGISGGEMRRVSIGLELVARPDVLLLDEPTSGLDSVSARKVANVLRALAHDQDNPTAVVASIHQPSSHLYHTFDQILLLSHGRALYSGPGGSAPAQHFSSQGIAYHEGYNVADYLLDVASDPPVSIFPMSTPDPAATLTPPTPPNASRSAQIDEKGNAGGGSDEHVEAYHPEGLSNGNFKSGGEGRRQSGYAATFLTQFQVVSGREWKILRRDWTLFFAHFAVAAVLGVFCGGLYFKTDITIAGFQSRVGCLFFLGALIAFSTLSALYHVVEIRPLFLRERSASYYSPTAWLLSRFVFDVIPLRVIPTIIVSTITYWMAGLAHEAANFFKFLFILVLYTLAMTLYNFLLACLFNNGGIAILLSALSALYQMTFAGFFVHLNDIPPVLRWLQWLCPLKYTLEALSVNEVGSGLMIQDTLQGVPVNVSASLIMNLLFGFGSNNYYRDVLVLFAFIAGFGVGVIGIVWLRVRERR